MGDLDRRYRYMEPGEYGEEIQVTITGAQIYTRYWSFWHWRMSKVGRPKAEFTAANCIKDFVTAHWAWEVLDD